MAAGAAALACALGGCGDARSDAVDAAGTWLEALRDGDVERACSMQLPTAAGSIRAKYFGGRGLDACPDLLEAYRKRLGDEQLDAILDGGLEYEGELRKDKVSVFPIEPPYDTALILMQRDGDAWKVAAVAIAPRASS